MYQDIKSFQDEVSEPGVELHCLYATDIQTVALYVWTMICKEGISIYFFSGNRFLLPLQLYTYEVSTHVVL